MQILVLSATPGDTSRACQVYDKLIRQGPVDLIIHCGDYYKDAIFLGERTGAPVAWVKGNTDGSFSDRDYIIVDTECGSLLVTHGHMENVDFSQQNLFYKAQENDCIAAVLITTGPDFFRGRICRYDAFMKDTGSSADSSGSSNGKPKVQGGYLRGLMNYSDRF